MQLDVLSDIYEWLRCPGAFAVFAAVSRQFRDSVKHTVIECPKNAVVSMWGFPCCTGKCSSLQKMGFIDFMKKGGRFTEFRRGHYEGVAALYNGSYYAVLPLRGNDKPYRLFHVKMPLQHCPLCGRFGKVFFHTVCGNVFGCHNCVFNPDMNAVFCPCGGRTVLRWALQDDWCRCTPSQKCQLHEGEGFYVRLCNAEMY